MSNFRTIADELVARGAARTVADPGALAREVVLLLSDREAATAMARQAALWHRENQGALLRSMIEIRSLLA
jgi:3-deoxy-D-manno-octulosonic-acid transferase